MRIGPDSGRAGVPRPAPAPAPAGAGGAAPPPYANPYDFTTDALYQRIMALGQQRTEQANAEALRERIQSAIDYGDADLARSLGLDANTIAAAGQNPFSIMAGLARNEKTQPLALDESLNKQNLFYSGHRGLEQSDLARSLLQARYLASQREQGLQSGITNTLTGSLNTIADQESQAAQEAAARRQTQLGDSLAGQPAALATSAATGTPLPATSGVGAALGRAAMPRPAAMPRRAARAPRAYRRPV